MKNFLLCFFICCCSFSGFSQEENVILRFHTYSAACLNADTNMEWGDWFPFKGLVILDSQKMTLRIIGGAEDIVIAFTSSQEVNPGKEDHLSELQFVGYDGMGLRLDISLVVLEKGKLQLYLNYTDARYCFSLEAVD